MLSKTHVVTALQAKQDAFQRYSVRTGRDREHYLAALADVAALGAADVEARLAGIACPGARPTVERIGGRSVIRPFEMHWLNHQEARQWAMGILQGVPTMAVDGSQIPPSTDFSIPVGAVQIGWFENRHLPDGEYTKDIHFEVLAPDEMGGREDRLSDFPDLQVNVRRFEGECAVLVEYMQEVAGEMPPPVCFFDGSLILSFAAQLGSELQQRYLRAIVSLVGTSEATHVPLVGYVDTSHAKDMVSMLGHVQGRPGAPHLSDGALLRGGMGWGDRTELFRVARADGVFAQDNAYLSYYDRVLFTYLQTARGNSPARLDLPAWLLADDVLLEQVIDVVRAEVAIGLGYPYAIETADAVAVITMEDRERFYRLFQQFSEREIGLPLRYARKAYSKRGRRS